MKKIIRIISLILSVAFLLSSFVSCGNKNDVNVMEYVDGKNVTASCNTKLFSLVMAVVNFQLGADSLTPEMWDMAYQEGNDTTVRDIVVAQTKAYIEGLLQAEYLCDVTFGIGVSDEQKDSVEKYVNELCAYYGSEKEFEKFLSTYGADVEALERYMTLVMKQDTLYKSFYSEEGMRYEEIDAKKESYFAENFHIADHILVKYSGPLKDDGTVVPLSEEEKEQKRNMAKALYNEIIGGVRDFDEALGEYNEDTYKLGYPFGYFVPENFYWTGISSEVQDAVCEMTDGEIRFIDTDDGAYIIRKNEMNPVLYASNGSFETYLDSTLAQEDFLRLCEGADGIVIYDDVVAQFNPALVPSFDIDAIAG